MVVKYTNVVFARTNKSALFMTVSSIQRCLNRERGSTYIHYEQHIHIILLYVHTGRVLGPVMVTTGKVSRLVGSTLPLEGDRSNSSAMISRLIRNPVKISEISF